MVGSLLNNAASTLWPRLKAAGSQTIRFTRGAGSVVLDAVPGTTRHQIVTIDGQISKVQTQDWLVLSSELVVAAVAVKPQRGQDKIELLTETTPRTVVRTFKVNHPGGLEPYRYSDPYRTIMRIHTTEVA